MPFPFSLNCFPFCVPSGILIFAFFPSIVGISIVVPRAASAIEIGNSKNKLTSDLLNKEQKDLLERFRKIENEKSNPSIKKFFQKAKSFWNS